MNIDNIQPTDFEHLTNEHETDDLLHENILDLPEVTKEASKDDKLIHLTARPIDYDPLDARTKIMPSNLKQGYVDEPLVALHQRKTMTYRILSIFTALFVTTAVYSIISAYYSIQSYINTFFINPLSEWLYSMFVLPAFLSELLIGVIFIAFAILFYIWAKRPREAIMQIQNISSRISTEEEPTQYLDLTHVHPRFLLKELKDRSCELEIKDTQIHLTCEDIPITEDMRMFLEGPPKQWYRQERLIRFFILNLVIVLILFSIRGAYLFGFMDDIVIYPISEGQDIITITIETQLIYSEIFFYIVCGFLLLVLYEMELVPLFVQTIIIHPFYLALTYFYLPFFSEMGWHLFLIISIILMIVTLIFYALRPYTCVEKEMNICDRL